MRVVRSIGLTLLFAVTAFGCAERGGAHLVGEIVYLGSLDAVEVPATAGSEVEECLGASVSLNQAGDLLDVGVGKVDERIPPPFFVGLWPKPAPGQEEIHGRHDAISVGAPRPGDFPFLKKVVCTAADFDWKVGELLGGEYYIAAWIDYDFNGFPGKDEPFGVFRGDDGSEDYDPSTTEPVAVSFLDEVVTARILIGNEAGSLTDQLKDIGAAIERALIDGDDTVFYNQFQPLYYKDALNRTYNELEDLWLDLVTDTHPASNALEWVIEPSSSNNSRTQTIILSQDKDTAVWDLMPEINRRVEILVGDHRDDGYFGIIDWRPLVEQSGDIDQSATVLSEFSSDRDKIPVDLQYANGVTDVWVGLEYFVPATDAPTGGTWSVVTATGNPQVCTAPSTILLTTAGGSGCRILLPDFDAGTLMRLTLMPIGDVDAGHYPGWTGYPGTVTEPARGNYTRFYFYGADYRYRKTASK